MAGLVPAIPLRPAQRVPKRDARDKPAHDGVYGSTCPFDSEVRSEPAADACELRNRDTGATCVGAADCAKRRAMFRRSPPMQTYQHFIDGAPTAPASNDYFDTVNPYTGEAWARIAKGNAADVDRAVAAARAAFWGR